MLSIAMHTVESSGNLDGKETKVQSCLSYVGSVRLGFLAPSALCQSVPSGHPILLVQDSDVTSLGRPLLVPAQVSYPSPSPSTHLHSQGSHLFLYLFIIVIYSFYYFILSSALGHRRLSIFIEILEVIGLL